MIIRVVHNKNYVVMNKTGLEDKNLSFKAKGLLAYLLSKPDNWKVNINHLAKIGPDGKTSVESGLKELEENKYLYRIKKRNKEGKFEWESIVSEIPRKSPQPGFPDMDNPDMEKPELDNQHIINNEIISNKVASNYKDIMSSKEDNPSEIPYAEIIDYLNQRLGSRYKPTTKKTRELIRARWNEGFRLEDFKAVIDKKCVDWIGTEWEKFLRPVTLFGTKFESYLNQLSVERKKDKYQKQHDALRELYQELKEEEDKHSNFKRSEYR